MNRTEKKRKERKSHLYTRYSIIYF